MVKNWVIGDRIALDLNVRVQKIMAEYGYECNKMHADMLIRALMLDESEERNFAYHATGEDLWAKLAEHIIDIPEKI